jgi:GPH family glycoside/pentoside/hexuronide:cation symporter
MHVSSAAEGAASFREQLVYASGGFGGQVISRASGLWLLYFYAPPDDADLPTLAPVLLVGVLLTIGRFIDALDDPLIGFWSDRTRSRWGRRIPFIVLGTPFYGLFFVLIWLPPVDHESAVNALYLFAMMQLYHLFGTVSGSAMEALMPEIATTTKDRVNVVPWQVVFGALGAAVGLIATGPIIEWLGFWQMGLICALLGMASRYIALAGAWRPARAVESSPADLRFVEALRTTFANDQFRAFLPTFVLYATGISVLLGMLPYYVTEVLGQGEGTVSILTAAAIVVVIACLPVVYWLSVRKGKAWVYSTAMLIGAIYLPFIAFAGYIPGIPELPQAVVMLALVGVPMAAVNAFPNAIMADVIDYDSVRTGMRREAMYFGTQNLVEKAASSLSPLIIALLLTLGGTSDDPLGIRLAGPVAGLFVLLGYLGFRNYRLPDEVTPESVREMGVANRGSGSSDPDARV